MRKLNISPEERAIRIYERHIAYKKMRQNNPGYVPKQYSCTHDSGDYEYDEDYFDPSAPEIKKTIEMLVKINPDNWKLLYKTGKQCGFTKKQVNADIIRKATTTGTAPKLKTIEFMYYIRLLFDYYQLAKIKNFIEY
jgi:hypothetical protein